MIANAGIPLCLLVSAFIISSSGSKPIPQKQQYMVGGWIPGDKGTFLKQWRPLLEGYLSESVGALYEPTINFSVVAVDYTPETRMATLISNGMLDFVCQFACASSRDSVIMT